VLIHIIHLIIVFKLSPMPNKFLLLFNSAEFLVNELTLNQFY